MYSSYWSVKVIRDTGPILLGFYNVSNSFVESRKPEKTRWIKFRVLYFSFLSQNLLLSIPIINIYYLIFAINHHGYILFQSNLKPHVLIYRRPYPVQYIIHFTRFNLFYSTPPTSLSSNISTRFPRPWYVLLV